MSLYHSFIDGKIPEDEPSSVNTFGSRTKQISDPEFKKKIQWTNLYLQTIGGSVINLVY